MADELRTIRFDARLESYSDFFDRAWAEKELARTDGTVLYPRFFDLVRNWKAASQLHCVPLALAKCVEASLYHHVGRFEPDVLVTIKVARRKLVEKLRKRDVSIRPALEAKIHDALSEIEAEAEIAATTVRNASQPRLDDVWAELLAQPFVMTTIWATERQAYCLLCFQYECFLKDCLKIARRVEKYRIGHQFADHLREEFGAQVENSCWSCQRVQIARFARHAFAHNGARMTDDLAKQPHDFLVEDGEIQVMAEHTVKLHAVLRDCMTQVITAALEHDAFKRP